MFTGIVAGLAQVKAVEDKGGVRRLTLSFPRGRLAGLERGASIAINGCCLTAVDFDDSQVRFDVIEESLSRTNLGSLKVGDVANFERAAKFGDEIGGHLLSGHILGTVPLLERVEDGRNLSLRIGLPRKWDPYVLTKGYVALDGVSLTIGEVTRGEDGGFWVHLIPETRDVTTFGRAELGHQINLEVDATTQAVVETTQRILAARESL